MPLACLNAMLNSNCKGEDALFFRAPGQAACFGLKVFLCFNFLYVWCILCFMWKANSVVILYTYHYYIT